METQGFGDIFDPVAEDVMLAAFIQGKTELIEPGLFTNQIGGAQRRVIAYTLSRRGRPTSPAALGMWLRVEGLPGVEIDNLFSRPVPDGLDQIDAGLRELAVRRNCRLAADELDRVAEFGAEDIEGVVGDVHDRIVAPLRGIDEGQETERVLSWGRAHIRGEEGGEAGFSSLWSPTFDNLVGPRGPGIYMLVAGPPGAGKSCWCSMDALDLSRQGGRVIYCSPDMGARRSLLRLAAVISHVPFTNIWRHRPPKKTTLTPFQADLVDSALDEIEMLGIQFWSDTDMPAFCAKARRYGFDAVYYDFVQKGDVPSVPEVGLSEKKASICFNLLRDLTRFGFVCGVSHEKPDAGKEPELKFPWSSEPQKVLDIISFMRVVENAPVVRHITKKNRDGPPGELAYFFYKRLMTLVELNRLPKGIAID